MSEPATEEREQKREPSFVLRSDRISGLLTIVTLVATVAAVYLFFPRRDNEVMTRAVEYHRDGGSFDVDRPTPDELRAWSAGVLQVPGAPWPAVSDQLELVGGRAIEIMKRPTAMVRYLSGGGELTVVVQRDHETPPRKHRRIDGGDTVISWRAGKFRVVAVGPTASVERWGGLVGAP